MNVASPTSFSECGPTGVKARARLEAHRAGLLAEDADPRLRGRRAALRAGHGGPELPSPLLSLSAQAHRRP